MDHPSPQLLGWTAHLRVNMPFSCLGSPLTLDNHCREHNPSHEHELLIMRPPLAQCPRPLLKKVLPSSPLGEQLPSSGTQPSLILLKDPRTQGSLREELRFISVPALSQPARVGSGCRYGRIGIQESSRRGLGSGPAQPPSPGTLPHLRPGWLVHTSRSDRQLGVTLRLA